MNEIYEQSGHDIDTNHVEIASNETAALSASRQIPNKSIQAIEMEQGKPTGTTCDDTFEDPVLDKTEIKEETDNDKEERIKRPVKRLKENEMLKLYKPMSSDEDFDAIEDKNQIYRKYRLRGPQKTKDHQPKPVTKPTLKPGGLFHCSKCSKKFGSKTGLLNHLRMHQTEKIFTCALCLETFKTNALLVAHKAVHTQEKRSYFCIQCKLAFSDHCDFIIHSVSHTQRSTYKCIECGLFYNKNGYKVHIPTHYGRKKECPICKAMISENYFNNHVKIHSSSCICVECGKDCRTTAYYKYHMRIHTGVKPYQCLYCGKGFMNSGQRRVHTRTHTNEHPFSCNLCERKFKQVTDLNRHKESHIKDKTKYQCDYCNKNFVHKTALRCHIRGHVKSGALYECPECNDAFTSMPGLLCHVKYKHTTERPVKCNVCGMGFINNNQYQRHLKSKFHRKNVYLKAIKKEEH